MKAAIGLDVGSTAVRMAAVRRGHGGPALADYGEVPLRRPGLEPADGLGPDPDAVTRAVKSLLKQRRMPRGPVSLGMVDQRMVAREVELPWVPQKELAQALPMLASDLLPMPVEECVLDFLPAEELVDPDGSRTLRGLLLAANEHMVTELVEAVESAGLAVDRVDCGPLAALHSTCDPMSPAAEAVLDLGASLTCLVVHEANRPTFVRVLAKGGDAVTESLAEQFGIEPEEAETWKVGLDSLWPTLSMEDRDRTRASLDVATAPLIEEIRSSVMFYRSNTNATLGKVWLTGGAAAQFGLDTQLREALRCEVSRATPGARLLALSRDSGGSQLTAEAAAAVGLALGVTA